MSPRRAGTRTPPQATTDDAQHDSRKSRRFLRFDRQFASLGVERLQRSSMTNNRELFTERNKLLTKLADLGLRDVLKAFAYDHAITIVDIERAFAEKRIGTFLDDRRANALTGSTSLNATTTAAATVPAPPRDLVTEAVSDAITDAVTPPSGERVDPRLARPLWTTAVEEIIPGMGKLEEDSRRRYKTSFRAFRTKAAVMAADEATFETLSKIAPGMWEALERARQRGVPMRQLRELQRTSVAERRMALRTAGIRLGEDVFTTLRSLDLKEWQALHVADLIPAEDVVRTLERRSNAEREAIRLSAARLGPDAIFADLDALSDRDWKNLAKGWGGSGADWNHLRRAIAAVLTTLFGSTRHPVRRRVVDRIALQAEVERIPDLKVETFWRIVTQLPEPLRAFPVVLVLTGMRIGEYLRTDRHHLQRHAHKLLVPGSKTRGSSDWVQVAPEHWSYIEAGVPAPLGYSRLREAWMTACAEVGIEGITLHDLRHCHGQWSIEGGAPESAVQVSLRHATAQMTRRYTKSRERHRVAAAISTVLRNHEPE